MKKQSLAASFAVLVLAAGTLPLRAETQVSENRKGNRLFAEGRYEDAEKAYLAAEARRPGRPEVLYNLGNSQIKQKKYEQGINTLRRSIEKGDKTIKENAWYNAGTAYLLMGDYKAATEAFIQALKLDPSDKDAKHNLELALMKLKQQRKLNPEQKRRQEQDQAEGEGQKPPSMAGRDRGVTGENTSLQRNKGNITKEQALQILDALKNQESQDRRMLLQHRTTPQHAARDW